MKRAADACSVEAYDERPNTGSQPGSQIAEAYVGQAGATFGTTRSRTALQIQIQIQIRRYEDTQSRPTRSCAVFGASFFKFIIWTCKFREVYLHFFRFTIFEVALPRFAWPLGLVRDEKCCCRSSFLGQNIISTQLEFVICALAAQACVNPKFSALRLANICEQINKTMICGVR